MAKNHYDLLGVSAKSSAGEIRSAYRKLVLKHHPDQSADPGSAERFREIVDAYEVLSDPQRRNDYDAGLALETARSKARARDEQKAAPRPRSTQQPAKKPNATKRREPEMDELSKLKNLFGKGRFEEAARMATVMLAKDRRSPIPYAVLGDIARARGDMDEAVNMYGRAVQAAPRNELYQRRYEELINASAGGHTPGAASSPAQWSVLFAGVTVCVCACAYISLSSERSVFPGIGPISTWTLGVMAMLFFSGVTAGVSLSIGGLLDRFGSVSRTTLGRPSPAMALATIAVVSFWAAATLYGLLGLSQRAFNYSTTRVVLAVGAIVCLSAISARYSSRLDGLQVLLWGGNLAYIGAMCGWMVADSWKGA